MLENDDGHAQWEASDTDRQSNAKIHEAAIRIAQTDTSKRGAAEVSNTATQSDIRRTDTHIYRHAPHTVPPSHTHLYFHSRSRPGDTSSTKYEAINNVTQTGVLRTTKPHRTLCTDTQPS